MKCMDGQWKSRITIDFRGGRTRNAGPPSPCNDAPGMNSTCAADKGHCLQYTEEGKRMERDCAGTCGQFNICKPKLMHDKGLICRIV